MTELKLLDPAKDGEDYDLEAQAVPEEPGLGGAMKLAIYGGVGFFLAFILFAAFAPISGGALATGVISPDGSRRTVQHLEGGIISRLLVRDGDIVKQGDSLMALNETQALAERNITRSRLKTLKIMEARMEAEQIGLKQMMLPFEIAEDDVQLNNFVRRQQTLLTQSLELAEARSGLFTERARQIRSEIEGLNGSIDSVRGQQVYLRNEISSMEQLVETGLYKYNNPRILALRREETSMDGQVASQQAAIARLRGQISEIEVQRLELEAQRQSELAQQLGEVRAQLAETEERLIAAEDILSRTIVTSPVDGRVVNLRYRTIGGVVTPGQPIVDVVPSNERLIIEAQVMPTDIDIIRPGQTAKVTFSALPRSLPQIDGNVLTVSADAILDERTGMSFYTARVEVPQETLEELNIAGKLSPGMPAEIMIKTESRTLLEYLTQPFRDTFRRGLKESDYAE